LKAEFLGVLVAVGATSMALAVTIPLLRRVAMDVPVARSSHTTPVPRGGGIAVVVGVLLGAVAAEAAGRGVDWAILAGFAALAAMGLVEDVRGLSIRARLVLQFAVAAAISSHVMRYPEASSVALLVVATIFMVGYANAFNFMDGVDGISALSVLLTMAWYVALGHRFGAPELTLTAGCIGASGLAFLPWNAPGARIFLGDSGSYGLGLAAAAIALALGSTGVPWLAVASPLVIYVADTSWTLAVRAARREAWYLPHREHVYQRIADLSSHMASAGLVTGFSGAVCAWWWLVGPRSTLAFLAGVAGLVLTYLALPRLAAKGFGPRKA
jgi:UDP-GlcNAc:undecaprenyl-phosphate GlcNAc-1-phosphate transferase